MGVMATEPHNIDVRKKSFNKTVGYGEPQTIDEWEVVFDVNEDLQYLAQTFQIPEMTRERIEDFGPYGVQIGWPGRPKNMFEVTASFKEVKKGTMYDTFAKLVREKAIFSFTAKMLPNGRAFKYEECFIETVEGLDLEYESNTIAKPSVTIVCNWGYPWNIE